MADPKSIEMQILLVDDDLSVRRGLGDHLRRRGHRVFPAEDGAGALDVLGREQVDIVITDIHMPGMDGFEVLGRVCKQWPEIDVIVITAYGDMEGVVRAMREGAFDYITKPFNAHDIVAAIQRTERFQALRRDNERFRERLERAESPRSYGLDAMIGRSAALGEVKAQVRQVVKARNTTVLINGETGTGKELVGRAIHYESERAGEPFVAVDCTSVPETLVESAFYGHVKGAFTDAKADQKGFFEQANGGTLFLDEIGDMPLEMQARLLRTLEERRVRRLGASSEAVVDVRLVSCTNRDLQQAMAAGTFREDLFYRLNTFVIHTPPLRERANDILLLAEHFMRLYARELRKGVQGFTPGAEDLLQAYDFPGNIRELRNMIERAVILCQDDRIDEVDLFSERFTHRTETAEEQAKQDAVDPDSETFNLAAQEKIAILRALRYAQGNKAKAARLLGIGRDALRRRLSRHDIQG